MKRTLVKGMESPISGGRVYLVEDKERHEFRKEYYDVHVRYYVCQDTKERFTDEKQDELFCNELYNQYRIKHGLPFPDEIKSIRERYKLNFTQITKLAGFGQNQWRHYEEGSVPSESNGRIIVALADKQCALNLLASCREVFSSKEYDDVKSQISESSCNTNSDVKILLFYGNQKRDYWNGYSALNADKLEDMVRYFVGNGVSFKTKLNKCLFYSDMLNYRKNGHSISGARYRAIQYGPVPEHYDTIYDNVEGIYKTIEFLHDKDTETLHTEKSEPSCLSDSELAIIGMVLKRFDGLAAREVVELSHQEEVWKRHQENHELIPYSESFDLKLFEE